jgi:hypothetical protein
LEDPDSIQVASETIPYPDPGNHKFKKTALILFLWGGGRCCSISQMFNVLQIRLILLFSDTFNLLLENIADPDLPDLLNADQDLIVN